MYILNKVINPILADIEYYFGFLFDKGFRIQETNVTFWSTRSWSVIFESPACVIKIYYDQQEVCLVFAPVDMPIDHRFGIEAVIYYLSNKQYSIERFERAFYKDRIRQLKRLAELLKKYIDQIILYFNVNEFQKYKSELLAASKEYGLIYMRRL